MTTTVTINAHCSNGIEVEITIVDKGQDPTTSIVTMQDGDSYTTHVWDTRSLSIAEVPKAVVAPNPLSI